MKLTDDEKRVIDQYLEAVQEVKAKFAKMFNPLDEYRGDIPRTPVMHDLLYKKETEMKTYACVVTIDMDEDCPMGNPVDWNWSEIVGPEVRVGPVTVIDVTDEPIERLRISADGVEEIL